MNRLWEITVHKDLNGSDRHDIDDYSCLDELDGIVVDEDRNRCAKMAANAKAGEVPDS